MPRTRTFTATFDRFIDPLERDVLITAINRVDVMQRRRTSAAADAKRERARAYQKRRRAAMKGTK